MKGVQSGGDVRRLRSPRVVEVIETEGGTKKSVSDINAHHYLLASWLPISVLYFRSHVTSQT